MTAVLIVLALVPLAGYLGFRVGERIERGRIERERALAEELAYQRSRRRGTVRLNSITIKR